jgi:asparagine synthase (glutamine-hydrolysing)
MCGFVGLVSLEPLAEVHVSLVHRMGEMIRHRGPDSQQSFRTENFACHFYRLAIVDPSDRANQPFHDAAGRYTLLFNGEIYNFRELKEELKQAGYSFNTTSDTEVVMAGYIVWGERCVDKFSGMFAIAIYDRETGELVLIRDQLGIKPLYYIEENGSFLFASEIKAFYDHKQFCLDESCIVEYAAFGSIQDSKTLFHDIRQVQPGHRLKISSALRVVTDKYFDLRDTFATKERFDEEAVFDVLTDSIIAHTRCDVDYGTQLSGGLDSSLVTAIASQNVDVLQTYGVSQKCDDLDEGVYQRQVAELYDTDHSNLIIRAEDFQENLCRCIWMFDYPLHHPSILPSYLMNKMASARGLKVLLTGDGSDEIFTGYDWTIDALKDKPTPDDIVRASAYVNVDQVRRIFPSCEGSLSNRIESIQEISAPYDALQFLDQTAYLEKWLHRQDRTGMFTSVEIRVPFCNVNLYKMLNTFDFNSKTNSGKNPKHILKKLARQFFPEEFVMRQKLGFPLPIRDWLRSQTALGACLEIFAEKSFRAREIYDHGYVDELASEHLDRRRDNSRILWMLINIEIWHRIFVDRTIAF